MAVAVSVRVENLGKLVRTLEKMSPRKNRRWVVSALIDAAGDVERLAKEKYIIRGGRFRGPAGPRGGKGKLRDRKPDPKRLTSRSGRLRASIAVNRRGLPFSISTETDVEYAAVHEFGGRFHRKRPFMAPALDEASKGFAAIFVREWERAINE